MGVLVQTHDGTMPLELMQRLGRLRRRYKDALRRAAAADFSLAEQLHALHTTIGNLLAREAKKSRSDRGMPMLDLSLSVYRYFPELREWSEREAMAAHNRRLQELTARKETVTADRAS